MPVTPYRLKAIKNLQSCAGKAGHVVVVIHPPTTFFRSMDNHYAKQQHLNNLRAFEDYERRLRALYAKSTNPLPRGWLRANNDR
jgi:hypothetical protein